jgi:hypothetical protein
MSLSERELMERYASWARHVRTVAEQVTVPMESAQEQKELLVAAHEQEAAAVAPVTVGTVGEYTTGKSLLLGTLLGRPDLLPVSPEATTGNVTSIRLRRGPAGSPVTVASISANLLSLAQVAEAAHFILDEIRTFIAQTHLPIETASLSGYNPVGDGWSTFEAWCRHHVWPDGNGAIHESSLLGLRDHAWELLRLRDALARGRSLLNPTSPGVPIPLDYDHYTAAVAIGSARTVPLAFPVAPVTVPLTGAMLSSTEIREVFPLVGRVNLVVSVPPDTWPIDALNGAHEVEFLDFPGLNARGSVRDDFLSASLLRPVHTIMITLRAERPGTAVPTKFLALLAGHGRSNAEVAEAVLVIGNMFDIVKVPVDDSSRTIEQLTASHSEFRALLNAGRDLTGHRLDRIALTSLFHAIDHYGMTVPATGEIGQSLSASRHLVAVSMDGWRPMARTLATNDPDHPLTRALAEVVRDGGLDALRDMITNHITTYGVGLKLSALRRLNVELRRGVTQLDFRHPGGHRASTGAVTSLFELVKVLGRAAQAIEDGAARLRPDTGDREARERIDTALETLRTDIAHLVFQWDSWDATLQHSDDKGQIPTISSPAPVESGPRERRHTRPGHSGGTASAITSTRSVHDRFRGFVEASVDLVDAAFRDVVAAWNKDLSDRLTEIWKPMPERLSDPANVAALAALDADGGELRRSWLVDLTGTDAFTRLADEQSAAMLARRYADAELLHAFPLLPAQDMPWEPESAKRRTDELSISSSHEHLDRHAIRVVRMRQEVTDAVIRIAQQSLLRVLSVLSKQVVGAVREVRTEIPESTAIRRLDTSRPVTPDPTDSPWRTLLDAWPDEL